MRLRIRLLAFAITTATFYLLYSREKPIRIALSTTVLSPDSNFPIWLEYHLKIVDVILIFMDDPERREEFEKYEGRRVLLFNGSTTAAEMSTESRLILRQDENNDKAIAYALQNDIAWLMHIDTDELFYEDGYHDWRLGDGVLSFVNHEAVPLDHSPTNPFKECTLFKMNNMIPFMAYGNGKSAVRITPGVYSDGPHQFGGYQGKERNVERPMVLHYPTPSFEIWAAKYARYGNFSNYWYDNPETPNLLQFMLDSRDIVQAALRTGNWEEAREFFNKQIPSDDEMQELLSSGALRIIDPLVDKNIGHRK